MIDFRADLSRCMSVVAFNIGLLLDQLLLFKGCLWAF